MAKIFLSTPTKMTSWLEVGRRLSRGSHQVVGQLTHLDDQQARSSVSWKLIDATKPRHEYLSSSSLLNLRDTDSYPNLWRNHNDVFCGLLNRKVWYALRSEPKQVFNFFCQYWEAVLNNTQPDTVVFASTPHTCYDYPLYVLSRYLDLKTLVFTKASYTEYVFVRENIFEDYCPTEGTRQKYLTRGDTEIWRKWLKRCQGKYEKVKPDKWDKPRSNSQISLDSIKLWTPLFVRRPVIISRLLLEKIASTWKWNKLEKKYKSMSSCPDYSAKYVYIPLHFQPERTTSPEGGVYHDQLKFVKDIATQAPRNVKLYVKEHPAQFKNYRGWMGRSLDFYERLQEINAVELISLGANQYKLIDNAVAVASVAGTAVIESIIRGTPATIGGYPWFCPGILYRANSKEKMRKFFADGLDNVGDIQSHLKSFLCYLPLVSQRCYTQGSDKYSHLVSQSDNINALCELIETHL
jgi:hypothetical protein